MEVRQSALDGTKLQFRVCKGSGTFVNDIWVWIDDGASSKASYSSAMLTAAGLSCTAWTIFTNNATYAYTTGQQFGGMWAVVSPYTSSNQWGNSFTCTPVTNATGTCWTGASITMTRTCL